MAAVEHVACTYKLEVQGKHKLSKFALCSLIFYAEDGGRMFLFNASILQIVYRTLYTKRLLYVLRIYKTNISSNSPVCYYHHVKVRSRSCPQSLAVEGRTWPLRPDAEPP